MADYATRDDIQEAVERLISLMQESFARIDQRFDEFHTQFATHTARLERHDGLLKTGSHWTVRINDWAEKVDTALEKKDKQIAELSERIWKLEKDRG